MHTETRNLLLDHVPRSVERVVKGGCFIKHFSHMRHIEAAVPRRARDGSNQGALLTMNCHQRAPATRKEALTDAVRSMDGTSASRLQPAGPASTGEGRQKAERTRSRRPARHRPAVEGVPRRQNRTLVKYAAPCTYTCNRSLHS